MLQAPSLPANPLLHHGHKDFKTLAEKLDGHQLFEPLSQTWFQDTSSIYLHTRSFTETEHETSLE